MKWYILKYWVGHGETTNIVKANSYRELMESFWKWFPKDVTPWKIEIQAANHADWLDSAPLESAP